MANPALSPEAAIPLSPAEPAAAARQAARSAGVRIELAADVPSLAAVARFLAQVWRTPEGQPPLGTDVLRSIGHAGGAVHIAHNGPGVTGACAAIFRPPAEKAAYSLIAAARSSDRGVGFALKQAQRAWALAHGATTMMWTFDPLVSRNARFNLVKLGATGAGYAVDFYGPLDDGIDGQDETDRLTAVWSLTAPGTIAAAAGQPAGVTGPDLGRAELDPRRAPDGGLLAAREEAVRWCRVPADIVAIRGREPRAAAAWRTAVRDVLLGAFADGFTTTGMTRDGWYRLTREAAP